MINVEPFQHCVCQKMANVQSCCLHEHGFSEQGKKVKLTPKTGEELLAVVLDGCVFDDYLLKCDGLFLFASPNRKAAILIELKGAGDIPHAFEQLVFVRTHRPQYKALLSNLNQLPGPKALEMAFIVSNGFLTKPQKEKLENQHGIRVVAVLHCEAVSQVPDLRQYL